MPAYISISNKEKNWLKKLLEEQLKFYVTKLASGISTKKRH